MVSAVVIASLISLSVALHCYDGWQIWDKEPQVNNVTLVECLPHHKCCSMSSSIPGTHYTCYEHCPPNNYHKCGPDPKLRIQDIYYCYCKDHLDKDCRPYLGEDDRRRRK